MDVLSLLGNQGGDGQDLTTTLTATTAAGELIFKAPFGDSTTWRSAGGGQVALKVLFDPFLPWTRNQRLASTTPDIIGDLRRELGKNLVPDKMAPTKSTRKETLWKELQSKLPKHAFDNFIIENGKENGLELSEFVSIIKKSVDEAFTEDEALIEALSTREFQFTYHLAIDAYPQQNDQKGRSGGSSRSLTGNGESEKLGVLVVNLEGRPNAMDTEKLAKVGSEIELTASPGNSDAARTANPPSPTLRNHRDMEKGRMARKKLQTLLDDLDLSAEKLEEGHNVWIKELPETAGEFFEQASSWFSAVLERNQKQLAEQLENNGASMYR
ncbi:Hypothetical Protein FCC1311_041692 [Hondaea fermentalgiana]|uniref:Uncharacterized protein n=1 Tax=Hondaea fermentalgiana TaxID=2315210 RepID=A0A2R5GA93_9STRA|nr:Hypothetical Protein FCC1311_041692 [Hondaea fermentalgiana]|eukprot:GBG27946.1 Hypothetical Protein FCC1311_041692 [Hondaea fermentalgiana]